MVPVPGQRPGRHHNRAVFAMNVLTGGWKIQNDDDRRAIGNPVFIVNAINQAIDSLTRALEGVEGE
jgi:hypothetical protein